MAKPFLIIQLRPEDATADNELAAIPRHGELADDEVMRLRAEQNGLPNIELEDFQGIIVGGSPFDVSTPHDEKTAIQQQVEQDFAHLFDRVIPADFPFLGCCSGNGLLGQYLGAPISTRYGEAVGGVDLTLTDAGRQDPLLEGFPNTFRVLLGHKEACDSVPPQSTLLASGQACPIQMFRVRSNVYATQFHPEADPEGFGVRIEIYKNHGYFKPETAAELIASISNEETPWAQRILRNFVRRYR